MSNEKINLWDFVNDQINDASQQTQKTKEIEIPEVEVQKVKVSPRVLKNTMTKKNEINKFVEITPKVNKTEINSDNLESVENKEHDDIIIKKVSEELNIGESVVHNTSEEIVITKKEEVAINPKIKEKTVNHVIELLQENKELKKINVVDKIKSDSVVLNLVKDKYANGAILIIALAFVCFNFI